MLGTLDEMQRMVEGALAFAREEAASEPTRVVDLAALVESVVADLADLGADVAFASPGKLAYACRPLAMRRALRNLVENAVVYGRRARVSLEQARDEVRIAIEDDGPGIPEEALERVFEPFVRLDDSRSPDTGGIGLGLSIARSIVRAHGGDIRLGNRGGGGLRATVALPTSATAPSVKP
jgi:signal transduction histidine kinase